jgi:hypothetical protein|eukprot:COSAG03_NODE_1489_length_3988_cov_2.468758_2_plen_477_part_00
MARLPLAGGCWALISCSALVATALMPGSRAREDVYTIVRVADNTTIVPGGARGAFTFFSAPLCTGGTAYFTGSPASGEGGIFTAALSGTTPPETIGIAVKTGPPHWASQLPGAPDGATIFDVGFAASGPEGVAFVAYPQPNQDLSLARLVLSVDGKLTSVVDTHSALSDGGTVAKFYQASAPGLGGQAVAFHAVSTAGVDGWWLATLSAKADGAPTISKIVDNSTAMPVAGAPRFHTFTGDMAMASDGSFLAFSGTNGLRITDPNARLGVFSWTKATNALSCVANDNDTMVPGLDGSWRFEGFGARSSVSTTGAICFTAQAINGRDPPHIGIWCKGVTTTSGSYEADAHFRRSPNGLVVVADSTMAIPASPTGAKFQYLDYPSVSPDGSTVVFQGNDDRGRRGVYAVVVGGPVIKLLDWQDKIAGQDIFNIQLSQQSFDGESVSIFVALSDMNEGIYSIPLVSDGAVGSGNPDHLD